MAVRVSGDAVAYARALAELETWRTSPSALVLAATGGSLLERVRRILRVPLTDEPRSPSWAVTLALTIIFTAGAGVVQHLPWLTDRLHNASTALLTLSFLSPVPVTGLPTPLADRLAWNFNQQELNLLVDLGPNLTLRGGHRYVWGDATVRAAQARPAGPFEAGDLRRHVGLAGVNFRTGQRFSINLDFEASAGRQTFFRTGLQDYERASVRARYQPRPSLVLAVNLFALRNTNPFPEYDLRWNYDGDCRCSDTHVTCMDSILAVSPAFISNFLQYSHVASTQPIPPVQRVQFAFWYLFSLARGTSSPRPGVTAAPQRENSHA